MKAFRSDHSPAASASPLRLVRVAMVKQSDVWMGPNTFAVALPPQSCFNALRVRLWLTPVICLLSQESQPFDELRSQFCQFSGEWTHQDLIESPVWTHHNITIKFFLQYNINTDYESSKSFFSCEVLWRVTRFPGRTVPALSVFSRRISLHGLWHATHRTCLSLVLFGPIFIVYTPTQCCIGHPFCFTPAEKQFLFESYLL